MDKNVTQYQRLVFTEVGAFFDQQYTDTHRPMSDRLLKCPILMANAKEETETFSHLKSNHWWFHHHWADDIHQWCAHIPLLMFTVASDATEGLLTACTLASIPSARRPSSAPLAISDWTGTALLRTLEMFLEAALLWVTLLGLGYWWLCRKWLKYIYFI